MHPCSMPLADTPRARSIHHTVVTYGSLSATVTRGAHKASLPTSHQHSMSTGDIGNMCVPSNGTAQHLHFSTRASSLWTAKQAGLFVPKASTSEWSAQASGGGNLVNSFPDAQDFILKERKP